MKKQRNPIVVFATMFFLLLLIILPPIFRIAFPKEIQKPTSSKKTVKALVCNRIYGQDMLQVDVTARYINNKIVINKLKYTKLTALPDDYEEKKSPVEVSITDEFTYLSSLKGVNAVVEGDIQTITLNDDIMSNNNTDERLKKYYNTNIEEEKVFFEEMGYSCFTQGN